RWQGTTIHTLIFVAYCGTRHFPEPRDVGGTGPWDVPRASGALCHSGKRRIPHTFILVVLG
ncbi:MAG: hypothetical protein ACLFWL_13660, partial [Candidatus Brocadiia bacterium]